MVGVREAGTERAAKVSDRFHIGSVTKSMTATMIARLIERGELSWELTLGKALADVEMHPVYREVTLHQLLRHRAGIVAHLTHEDAELQRLGSLEPGKDANIVLWDGDPFEPQSTVQAVMLEGRIVTGEVPR